MCMVKDLLLSGHTTLGLEFGLYFDTICSVSNIIERFKLEITRVSNLFSHYVWKIGKICPY